MLALIATFLTLWLLVPAAPVQAQTTGPELLISEGAPPTGYEQVLTYSGSNLIAVCLSPSNVTTGKRAATLGTVSAISKANPAVVTSTAHGFATSARPQITISGATGTGWTGINTSLLAVVVDANSFSLETTAGAAVDSSGFGTLGGTVFYTTTAPRSGIGEWAVKKLGYDGSNNLIFVGWLNGSSKYQAKCSDASSTTLNQQ